MTIRMQELVLPVLAAGAVVSVIRSRRTHGATGERARTRELAWAMALLLISVSVLSALYPVFARNNLRWWALLIPLAAAAVLVVKPVPARQIVPVVLVLYGLFGFVVARDYVGGGINTYGVAAVGTPDAEADFVLPQAYVFLLAGSWLLWNSEGASPRVSSLLGRLADLQPRGQLLALLLLPVMITAAAFATPDLWLGAGPGIVWTLLLLAGTVVALRNWPEQAARAATAGILGLGLMGLALAVWAGGGGFEFARTLYGGILYGGVLVSTQHTADAAGVEGLALLGLGAWLAPQTFPQVRRLLGMAPDPELLVRVQRLTESRAVAVDTASADLRRLERDLHDGAQARLVALGMSLRAAERLIPANPDAALALVAEARETSVKALTELRELVRGVLPPVLADRGLADAIRALALDNPLHVQTEIDVPGRLPAPVETACYFAVAELLTNAAKHSGARDGRITMSHSDRLLRIEVTDFGLGGADPARGSGLAGVQKRLDTFDGILAVSSPVGGPTMAVIEVPCALSSAETSPR
jgi:signal transduction histidine kinase